MGVGLEPSSGLRVRKNRKETTIIEVNTIYSPELLNGWDLHMARPRAQDTERIKSKKYRKNRENIKKRVSAIPKNQWGLQQSSYGVYFSIYILHILRNIMTVVSYSTYPDMWHCIRPSAFWAPSSTCKGVMLML